MKSWRVSDLLVSRARVTTKARETHARLRAKEKENKQQASAKKARPKYHPC